MDSAVPSFVALAAINIFYIAYYARKSIVHPFVQGNALFIMYFSGKFFYFYFTGQTMPRLTDQASITESGNVLLIFFALTAFFHFAFSRFHHGDNVWSAEPRASIFGVNFALIALILIAVTIVNGPGLLSTPRLLRVAVQSQGMDYLSQLYILSAMVGVVRCFQETSRIRVIQFAVINVGYAVLLALPGYFLTLFLVAVTCQSLVYRKLNIPALIIGAVVLPILTVFFLSYRLAATGSISLPAALAAGFSVFMAATGTKGIFYLIFTRTDQLETFSNLVHALRWGDLQNDPLFPLYVFTQPIPRAFWPDKPLNFSLTMTSHFDPSTVVAGAANNYLGLGELYYAFDAIGILVAAIITGWCYFFLGRYSELCYKRPGVFVVMFTVISFYIFNAIEAGYFNDAALPLTVINAAGLFLFCSVKKVPTLGL